MRADRRVHIVDVGSSYGINGALLKLDVSYDQLVANYSDPCRAMLSRRQLLELDRQMSRDNIRNERYITGVDISMPALQYAVDAGFIDGAISVDLEAHNMSEADRQKLVDTDLVISTGCVGYVGHDTINRLIDAMMNSRPWSAHFVLRMFSFDEIAAGLARRGYVTIALAQLHKQRKFISRDEQSQIVRQLRRQGVDTTCLEDDGYLYARFYLSIPEEELGQVDDLIMEWGGERT